MKIMVCRSKYNVGTLLKNLELETNFRFTYFLINSSEFELKYVPYKNRKYTLNSSLDFYISYLKILQPTTVRFQHHHDSIFFILA